MNEPSFIRFGSPDFSNQTTNATANETVAPTFTAPVSASSGSAYWDTSFSSFRVRWSCANCDVANYVDVDGGKAYFDPHNKFLSMSQNMFNAFAS